MLDLALPWWEFVVRAALAYVVLLVLLRMTGKRAFGELAPFDIVVLILVGGALRSALVGEDKSFAGPVICVATILALDKIFGWLAAHSRAFDRLLEGRPVLLVRNGELLVTALEKNSISREAFDRELRVNDLRSVADVAEARLEPTGRITFLRRGPVDRQ